MKFNLKLKPSELDIDEISIPLAVLSVVAVTGFLTVAMIAPNSLQILRMFKKKKYYCKSRIENCLSGLIKNGFISKDKTGHLSLTPKGELRLLRYQEELKLKKKKKKKWDGKWRIVIFDIWEKSRKKRDFLRRELADFGFIKLQNSVWITPYDCEDYVGLLKTDVGLGRGVIYIVADKVDNEVHLKKVFKL
jgi:DNA-binding transcriptional regulator PaaX